MMSYAVYLLAGISDYLAIMSLEGKKRGDFFPEGCGVKIKFSFNFQGYFYLKNFPNPGVDHSVP